MHRDCSEILGWLPEWERDALKPEEREAVARHLRDCEECSAEAELIASLLAVRPEPPPGFEARIGAALDDELAAVGSRRDGRRWPAWMLSMAAVLVLALGTAVVWDQLQPGSIASTADSLEPVPDSWLIDDAVVAGAPVLDDLSEEDLSALLEEFGG